MKPASLCAALIVSLLPVAAAEAQPAAPAAQAPLKIADDTPIEAIAATPAGKAALAKFIPELLPHPAYEQFKGMSLRALEPLSGGIITDEKIAAVEASLKPAK